MPLRAAVLSGWGEAQYSLHLLETCHAELLRDGYPQPSMLLTLRACLAERHLEDPGNYSFAEHPEAVVAGLVREVAAARPDAIAIHCTNFRGATVAPSVSAACQTQRGSQSIARASATMSACPVATMVSAWIASVIIPTAMVGMPASARMRAAKAVW